MKHQIVVTVGQVADFDAHEKPPLRNARDLGPADYNMAALFH